MSVKLGKAHVNMHIMMDGMTINQRMIIAAVISIVIPVVTAISIRVIARGITIVTTIPQHAFYGLGLPRHLVQP